jgi:hypothetical protein
VGVFPTSLYIISQRYRKAFLACRKHRIDMEIIIEQGFDAFMNGVERFLQDIPEVDHISLFLANIGYVYFYFTGMFTSHLCIPVDLNYPPLKLQRSATQYAPL